MNRRFGIVALLVFVLAGLALPLPAQLRVQPVGELPGDVALRLLLRQLASVGTFMQTTAHPDDEDNALLAMMSHGEGMRSVLVSATRGDGGQNEIGPEIFQALGVLRTEELLAVHRFDGAEQYFTRAIDFGYSFSLDESVEKWGRDEIVGDYVRHIRATRPEVIAGFLCGGEGGGQHHQASTRLTAEAFRAAADPSRYPEQIREGLRAWQASRLFCTEGFAAAGRSASASSPALLPVPASGFDPLLGRTYAELGLEARSMHKCQGTSQLLLLPGQSHARMYRLLDTAVGTPVAAPAHMFEGIDTSLPGLAAHAGPAPAPALIASLQAIDEGVAGAITAVAANGPAAAAPRLAGGLAAVRDLRAKLSTLGLSDAARYEIDFRLARKESQFQEALLLSRGIRLEALADDGTVVVGQPLEISAVAGNNGPPDVTLTSVDFAGVDLSAAGVPAGIVSGSVGRPVNRLIPAGGALTSSVDVWVGRTPLSSPYWTPRIDAARYDFEADVPFGVPFRPTPFKATFALSIAGAELRVDRTVEFRYSDLFAGEKRMELQVVPALAVRATPAIAVIPTGGSHARTAGAVAPRRGAAAGPGMAAGPPARTVRITVANNRNAPVTATASLRLPAGWRATPASAPVSFARQDEEMTVTFAVTAGPGVRPGEYVAEGTVTGPGGLTSSAGYEVVEYPHIRRRHVVEPARTRIKVIDVAIAPGLRVGYIMGVGDEMPAAIEQLGAQVQAIEPDELASGDLSKYNVVVTGVRAYERRPDLRANNHRLLSYVEHGGTVLVNYNKQEFNQAQYGPYPVKVGTGRVTDEHAPVEVLAPGHPVFTTPNRIGPETWAGWVQERGTYFLAERDPRYVDLVRTTDPFPLNPGPKTGALVEARYGKGRWIYIGLGLWRQLPAGTDGAYRLLANLLSLGRR